MTSLELWLRDRPVAHVQTVGRGRRFHIAYLPEVVAEVGHEVALLSCSLPTPGPSRPGAARAFLEGLLPEGSALEVMAAGAADARLLDGAPATPGDAVRLLAAYGRECAGAVVAVPRGAVRMPTPGRHEILGRDDVATLLRALPAHPLGSDIGRGVRMSLAGAQPKLPLARIGDSWALPVDGAASTHILKPQGRWSHGPRAEALIMHLARAVGVPAAGTWLETFGGDPVLVVERYDRTVVDGHVTRHHQEDMCQALAIRPRDKYRVGRPSGGMAAVLRRWAQDPGEALAELFAQVAFRATVGDADGHGKNYALQWDGDGMIRLAPLYDATCTLLYRELDEQMAMPLARETRLAGVDRPILMEEAAAMGVPAARAGRVLDRIGAGLTGAALDPPESLTRGWPAGRLLELIVARVRRLMEGEPMGRPANRLRL